jgi:hypothetical protein
MRVQVHRFFTFLVYILIFNRVTFAQPIVKVMEQKTAHSLIMSRNVKYTIYRPADYDYSERSYPVVYLLHDYTDDNKGRLQFGEINLYADMAITDGKIPP